MDPATLIPVVEPLPVHWAWFDILLIVTFTAHLLFMNALFGSAFIGLARSLRGKHEVMKQVGMKLPPLLALTINMGVAPLLFLQVNYGHFDYVSSVLMGGWWFAVVAVLLYSYYGFYYFKFKYDAMNPGLRTLLYASSLLGLLYVGFMFTNNMTLMLRPEAWTQYFESSDGFLNWGDPTLYPRFLHFIVGAIALGGLFIALLGQVRDNTEFIDLGMRWFTHATLTNLAVGVWFLMTLPSDIILAFMGKNLPATLTLVASLAAMVPLLMAGFKKQPRQAAVWASLTVFLMVCSRHWLRTLSIQPYFDFSSMPVTNQYGSFYLFLGFLVAGLIAVAYMVKLYLKARGRGV
ncbi:hypothetical protein [Pseudodesulfovibrio sediminis]|uniref:Uncharacterized protein n=1 Tax=Pseudodesulfovibrio sediminis TaxID=2810563 RepID=A0ABM7P8B2_9BACT|nr:hypothetical protein [Pseudodesulfovibrio sediminis]BCS89219.1 hypothetical protein PSDVSF_24610 [Pseudodesulfovibrio sediminis]